MCAFRQTIDWPNWNRCYKIFYGYNSTIRRNFATALVVKSTPLINDSVLLFQNLTNEQGCQMAYFQTKVPNLGKFWMEFQWKMLVYFDAISLFCGLLVYVMVIWYIIPVLVCCTKKNLATLQSINCRF
jgi:hypothetical protein